MLKEEVREELDPKLTYLKAEKKKPALTTAQHIHSLTLVLRKQKEKETRREIMVLHKGGHLRQGSTASLLQGTLCTREKKSRLVSLATLG